MYPGYIITIPRPPISTLFPYTTLFRSILGGATRDIRAVRGIGDEQEREERVGGLSLVLHIVSDDAYPRSEEHTSELQSRRDLVCRLLLEKKKKDINHYYLTL